MKKILLMEFVIAILEKEKKTLEAAIREQNLMMKDMRQATATLKNINDIKKAVKVLKLQVRKMTNA